MTPADYLELINMYSNSAALNSMNAIAVLTAYITAIYLAGKNLSKFQLGFVSILYTAFYFSPSQGVIRGVGQVFRLIRGFIEDFPDEAARLIDLGGPSQGAVTVPLILFFTAGWIGSILFMIDVRRKTRIEGERSS